LKRTPKPADVQKDVLKIGSHGLAGPENLVWHRGIKQQHPRIGLFLVLIYLVYLFSYV